MVPLIFLAQWNEPGGAKREELWIKAGSHSAISQRRKTLAGTGVGVGVGDTPTVVNENVSLRAESFSAVNGTQKTEVPLVWNAGMYGFSVLILIAYSLTVLILSQARCTDFGETGKWTGVVTSGTFLVLDAVTFILHGSHLLTTPWAVNMVLLVSRGCVVSFGSNLWYVGHAAMFLVYGLTVGTICVAYRLRKDDDADDAKSSQQVAANETGAHAEAEATNLRTATASETKRPSGCLKHPYTAMAILLLAVVLELVMVVIVVPNSFDIATVKLMDGSLHQQYEFGFGALFLVLGWSVFYLWYCLMRREAKSKGIPDIFLFTKETKILLVIFCTYFIVGGIGLYIITTSFLILFSAIFLPPMIICGMLLYGRWVGNDFRWCQRRSLRRNTRGDEELRRVMGDQYNEDRGRKNEDEDIENPTHDADANAETNADSNADADANANANANANADADADASKTADSDDSNDNNTSPASTSDNPNDGNDSNTSDSSHTNAKDKKTKKEIDDDYIDYEYASPSICDKSNQKYADPLCKEGCSKCCGRCRNGDFRKTHWCIALFRGGMTNKDYENITMLFLLLLFNILWGLLTYASEPDTWNMSSQNSNSSGSSSNSSTSNYIRVYDNTTNSTKIIATRGIKFVDSKRIAPAMTLITLLVLFTLLPLMEHFNTLRPVCSMKSIHILFQAAVASLLHIGLHLFIWREWQSGFVTQTSLVTLLSFLLYPSIIFMAIGLYKWKDDKWLVGRHYNPASAKTVIIYLGISQIIILAFDIIVGVLYSWTIGIILLLLHGSFLLVLASLVVWVLKKFYLPRAWKFILGCIFFLFIIGGLVGIMFSSGTDAFLSFTMSWSALLIILLVSSLSILVPLFQNNNIIISQTIMPSYEWDTSSGKLRPHYYGIYTLYGAMFVAISWGVAATLFLNQLYIGMSATSASVVVTIIITTQLINHSKTQFGKAISSLQASEFLILDSKDDATAGAGADTTATTKKKSLVDVTIEEALIKANKLFSEAGDVETDFGMVIQGDGGGGGGGSGGDVDDVDDDVGGSNGSSGKSSSEQKADNKKKKKSKFSFGRTRSRRHGVLPRPSSDGKVLTKRILTRNSAFPNRDHSKTFATARDLADDIVCIEQSIQRFMNYNSCCGNNPLSEGEDKTSAVAEDVETPSSVDVETPTPALVYPIRHDEAPLSVLYEALATLDQDYMLTVDHENDLAAAFRNLVMKLSKTQILNSKAQYSLFLDWCRKPEQKQVLNRYHLLEYFGKEAQISAQRSTRAGGLSPIELEVVFSWQETKADQFSSFQSLLKKYNLHDIEAKKERKRRELEDAEADTRRQQALREAEDRRRQEQADEYRRQHQAEADEMERKRLEEGNERRRIFQEEQERKRKELQEREEKERKEEEERNQRIQREMEEAKNNQAERSRLEALRRQRKEDIEQKRRERARKADEERKNDEQKLQNDERRRRQNDNDRIIHQMNQTNQNKYMTEELFTNKALQKELALTKLRKDPSNPTKLVDAKWSGKKAIMINPKKETTLSRTLTNNGNYKMLRPDEFCENPRFVLEDNAGDGESGYSASDVMQGSLGDCWFLSAMAVVAAHPTLMKKVMVTSETNDEGYYIIRIFKHGEWHNVVVDDKIPCRTSRGRKPSPICVKSKSGHELWMSILEKGYSKYHGSYEAINGGQVHVGLADLTGGVAGKIELKEKRSEIASGELFAQVKQYFDSGYLMGAGSPSGSDTDISETGIVQGHAYSILNIVEESDQNGAHQLIELRNPWGSGEWNGQWSDRDQRSWTSRMRLRLNYTVSQSDVDDGTFWMSFQDFCRNYSEISLCRMFVTVQNGGKWHKATMQAEWKGQTAGGCPQPANKNSQYNPQWLLKLTRPGHVFIQLEQAKLNFAPGRIAHEDLVSVAIFVMKLNGKRLGNGIYGGMEANSAPFINAQMKTLDISKLNMNNDGYTVVCTTFLVSTCCFQDVVEMLCIICCCSYGTC